MDEDEDEDDYGDEEEDLVQADAQHGQPVGQQKELYIDLNNYKGIYFNDENKKYQDDETGAHFEYHDLCRRMLGIQKLRQAWDERNR